MSIRSKIGLICAVFLCIVAGTGLIARQATQRLSGVAVDMYDKSFRGMSFAAQAQAAFVHYEEHPDRAALQPIVDRLAIAAAQSASPHTTRIATDLGAAISTLQNDAAPPAAGELARLDREMDRLTQHFSADGLKARDAAASLAIDSNRRLVLALGVAIAGMTVAAVLLHLSVVPPIRRAVAVAEAIASGRLDSTIRTTGRDETAALLRALSIMQDSIASSLHVLQAQRAEAAARAAASSEQAAVLGLAAAEFETSVGGSLSELGHSTDRMRATSETMSHSADQTSMQAGVVAEAARATTDDVQAVAAATRQLSASIREIAVQVTRSQEIARRAVDQSQRADSITGSLTSSAGQIGEIVELIQTIAGQTNLLALNATIEAARAGEAGRGFAVVASEVKQLASQTAAATNGIATLVQGIRDASAEAAQAVATIGSTIDEISRMTGSISAAVEQQDAAATEIAGSIQRASGATQTVSSSISSVTEASDTARLAADQVLDVTRSVSTQADRLQGNVSAFLKTVRRKAA